MKWDAGQYLRYEKERTQPAIDLSNRITLPAPGHILDVGCGPGNSTAVLAAKFPAAQVLGIDSSPDMIDAARGAHPSLRFQLHDATQGFAALGSHFDVLFSNACIQWVPNHPRLLADMLAALRPGGMLAVQVPVHEGQHIHRVLTETLEAERWRGRFKAQPRVFHTLAPADYFDILSTLSGDFSIWQTTYLHSMAGPADIVEWYRGTGLRPYLAALEPEDAAAFEADFLARVAAAYPPRPGGQVIFPFPRLFFTAVK